MRIKPQTFKNPKRRVSFLCEQFDVSEMRLVQQPKKNLVYSLQLSLFF